ncbi:MAG: Lhr-like helicase, partial [Deltaproteobacteria bacterium]|nr:Lhr-like helicase [Deltaproteobacteria bacterium]
MLGWILIALIMQAHDARRPIRIGVSALTHQAIDNALKKVVDLVNQYLPGQFSGHCIKWGAKSPASEKDDRAFKLEFSDYADDVLGRSRVIIGATGYGLYHLFKGRNKQFPPALDWVIFDEASQVPVPQALLALVYGRGNFLFLGDVNQLPPIVKGNYESVKKDVAGDATPDLNRSVLANLLDRYPESRHKELNITFRMNKSICAFPSQTWYNGRLMPAPANACARISLDKPLNGRMDQILDPAVPLVLVLTRHEGCAQKSETEAALIAELAWRLLTVHGVRPGQLGLISPHRAQNNAILRKLEEMLDNDHDALPVVDTVERFQGAERDII